MSAAAGNHHVLRAGEMELMKANGQWDTWIYCASNMAQAHPAAGTFKVEVVHEDRYMTREIITR
jgi:hypothetical protein